MSNIRRSINRRKYYRKPSLLQCEEGRLELYYYLFIVEKLLSHKLPFLDPDIFSHVLPLLPEPVAQMLMNQTSQWAEKHISDLIKNYDINNEIEDILSIIPNRDQRLRRSFTRFLSGIFRKELVGILSNMRKTLDFSGEVQERKTLESFFKISRDEFHLLKIVYYLFEENLSGMEDMISRNINDIDRMSAVTGFSRVKVLYFLRPEGPILRAELLDKTALYRNKSLRLSDGLIKYFSNLEGENSLFKDFFILDIKTPLPLSSFSLEKKTLNLLKELLFIPGPANLFFHGKPGTGKTELCRTLARQTGKRILFIRQDADLSQQSRYSALEAAINITDDKDLIVVDEADFFLNTGLYVMKSVNKGWINDFLDRSERKIIWVSNVTGNIDESVLRRFSFSLAFDSFTAKQRLSIWKTLLAKSSIRKLLPPAILDEISEQYQVNAAGIKSAISTLESLGERMPFTQESLLEKLDLLLGAHEKLIHRWNKKAPKPSVSTEKFNPEFLHTSYPLPDLMDVMRNVRENLLNKNENERKGINLLFWGQPGTGKTELARYLAVELKRPLHNKRYSDLESPFVGMTERNIAAAFRNAAASNAILFIDEADSFFTSRSSAERSWEISRTNELLTQMEHFPGIFICSTNLLDNMDNAAMRRFHFKIEFKPTQKEKRLLLYHNYFTLPHQKTSGEDENSILEMDGLTPGDLAAVYRKNEFIPKQQWEHKNLISSLRQEISYRKGITGKIGFRS